jgi:flagellar biosynthesis protein
MDGSAENNIASTALTEPTEGESPPKRLQAVALQYLEGDKAPRVIASGVGELARRILQMAEENNIPVTRDDSLVDILTKLNVGVQIPPETYRAVAEILAFLYRTDELWRKRKESSNPAMAKAAQTTAPAKTQRPPR